MKISELRQKSREELRALLDEERRHFDESRVLIRQKKVKNVKELKALRRHIARILTLLHAHS